MVADRPLPVLHRHTQDPEVKKLDAKHRQKMVKLQDTFEKRNQLETNNWTRKVQPYELLLASSPAGVTGRGVPYSVSI